MKIHWNMYNVKWMTFLGFIFGFAVAHICNMTFFGNTIALVLYVKNTGESVRTHLFCGQSGEGGKTIYSFRFTLLTLMAFREFYAIRQVLPVQHWVFCKTSVQMKHPDWRVMWLVMSSAVHTSWLCYQT